jgi:hypothetical protein
MANIRMTFTNDIKDVTTNQKAIMNKGRPNRMTFIVDDRDRHDIIHFAHHRWWNVRSSIVDDDTPAVSKNTVLAKL